jgi:hypothetical protein
MLSYDIIGGSAEENGAKEGRIYLRLYAIAREYLFCGKEI